MQIQEVYDKIKNHLLLQQDKSMTFITEEDYPDYSSDVCAYRGQYGMKCAVGVLIDDKAYDEDIEGLPWYDAAVASVLKKSGLDLGFRNHNASGFGFESWLMENPTRKLLAQAQHIHDNVPVDEWQDAMEQLAESLGLEP